jgi:hypothetical protein
MASVFLPYAFRIIPNNVYVKEFPIKERKDCWDEGRE